MSETPRTDAKEKETEHGSDKAHAHYGWKFARALERELASVKRRSGDNCACRFDEDDNQVGWCSVHLAMREEVARLRSILADTDRELRAAWDKRILPAIAISAELCQRIAAEVEGETTVGEATNIERDRFDVWWASIERAMNERDFTKAEIARAAWAAAWAAQDANQQALDAECARWKEIMTDELAETRRLMDLGGAREGENFTAFLERMIAERGNAS